MVDVGGCKIGISNRPERRRRETHYLSRSGSVWTSYVPPVVRQWYLPGGRALLMEGEIKARFGDHAVGNSTEWFNVSPHEIIDAVENTVRERFNLEPCRWYKDGTVLFRDVREPKMADRHARAIWHDLTRYPARADAIEAMRGWTTVTAWRAFGPRELKRKK